MSNECNFQLLHPPVSSFLLTIAENVKMAGQSVGRLDFSLVQLVPCGGENDFYPQQCRFVPHYAEITTGPSAGFLFTGQITLDGSDWKHCQLTVYYGDNLVAKGFAQTELKLEFLEKV